MKHNGFVFVHNNIILDISVIYNIVFVSCCCLLEVLHQMYVPKGPRLRSRCEALGIRLHCGLFEMLLHIERSLKLYSSNLPPAFACVHYCRILCYIIDIDIDKSLFSKVYRIQYGEYILKDN